MLRIVWHPSLMKDLVHFVIPAKAGIQAFLSFFYWMSLYNMVSSENWLTSESRRAFAGMTRLWFPGRNTINVIIIDLTTI